MVRASMDVDVYNVSIHGWANNETGQQVAYLQMFIMWYLLQFLCRAAYPTDPKPQKMTYDVFVQGSSWHWPLQGRQTQSIPKCPCGKKKPSVCFWTEVTNSKSKLRNYLVPIAVSIFKDDRCIEGRVREILASCHLRELPFISRPTYTALSNAVDCIAAVPLDSDPYLIGIDTHVSRCMVNAPHLFEVLKLGDVGEVKGIKSGLDIKGTGKFKFRIKDNNGMTHKIKIPNSVHVPELRRCLMSPQHWVQEAKDNYPRPKGTRMDQANEYYFLNWGQAKYPNPVHRLFIIARLLHVCHHL